ncbi:MAG: ATP-binding cassette domain-containing protein [Acetobacteraceae bacterium]|nr:ATP-binding cassette domain-containing protein [Acetobacteraceae bacterium]
MADTDLLAIEDLAVHFPVGGGMFSQPQMLRAVDGVSLRIRPGESLGLVGESGCGKSTLALSILGLVDPTRGRVVVDGTAVGTDTDRLAVARTVQMVFQDPYASLNPRQTVRRTLAAPLRLHGITNSGEVADRVAEMLRQVGLRPDQADLYPHEFSGGQRQRIGIARALILKPKLVICDEPVSALDVSIRAQIINLLLELQAEMGLSYLMISHDLGVVEHMSDKVAVMYLGRIVETGGWREIFERPRHPYTRALIAAIPDPLTRALGREKAHGEVPSPLNPPPGCTFNPRCPHAIDKCRASPPVLSPIEEGHLVSCWRAEELSTVRA